MIPSTYGDLARWHTGVSHTNLIKSQIRNLSEELASGQKTDLAQHLKFDQIRVAEIDTELARAETFNISRQNASSVLTAQQLALSKVNQARTDLGSSAISLPLAPSPSDTQLMVSKAQSAFSDMVRDLNGTMGGQSLFGGNKLDGAPLPSSAALLADLKATVDFTQSATQIQADITAYFTDPAGRFETDMYQGGTSDGMTRDIGGGKTVAVGTNVLDTGIRQTLAAVAVAAVAGEASTDDTKADLLRGIAGELMTGAGLTGTQARIGQDEGRIGLVASEENARATALKMERNDRVSADPFETASHLQRVQIQLETHFTMLGRMSKLSLVNFL